MSEFSQDSRYYYPLNTGNIYNNKGTIGKNLENGTIDILNNIGPNGYINYDGNNDVDYVVVYFQNKPSFQTEIKYASFNEIFIRKAQVQQGAFDNYPGIVYVTNLWRDSTTVFGSDSLQIGPKDVQYFDSFVAGITQSKMRQHEYQITDSVGNRIHILGYYNKVVSGTSYKVWKVMVSEIGSSLSQETSGTGYFYIDTSTKVNNGYKGEIVSTTYGMSTNHYLFLRTTDENATDYVYCYFMIMGQPANMTWGITSKYQGVYIPAVGEQGNKKVWYVEVGSNRNLILHFTDGTILNCRQDDNKYTLTDKMYK